MCWWLRHLEEAQGGSGGEAVRDATRDRRPPNALETTARQHEKLDNRNRAAAAGVSHADTGTRSHGGVSSTMREPVFISRYRYWNFHSLPSWYMSTFTDALPLGPRA